MEPPTLYDRVLCLAESGAPNTIVFRDEGLTLDWASLVSAADVASAALHEIGVRQGSVAFLCSRNTSHLLAAFLGSQRLGAIPAILAPRAGTWDHFSESLALKARLADPAALLVDDSISDEQLLSLRVREWNSGSMTIDRICCVATRGREIERQPSAPLSFLQFTSGSEYEPRAVRVTHANVIANCSAMKDRGALSATDTWVSWLPLFHDMGLVGATALPILTGMSLVLSDSASFIRNPRSWLRTVTEHRGTIICAPNFAYGLCARWVPKGQLENLDLSSVRRAFNGSEPIDRSVVDSFAERFAPYGFSRIAFSNVYGLAESTLAATMPTPDAEYKYVTACRSALEQELVARYPANDDRAIDLVSVGTALNGHELRIADPDTGLAVPEMHVGEIHLKGPSIADGYLGDEFPIDNGWYRTGDLGLLKDGELYVAGRIKELIKRGGRNYFPTDIEQLTAQVDGIRLGGTAAFEVEVDGHKGIGIVAEAKGATKRAARLADEIQARVGITLALSISAVWVVKPRTLPKTTSGKIQRRLAARRAERGLYGPPAFLNIPRVEAIGADARTIADAVYACLRAARPSLESVEIPDQATWSELGLDSLDVVTIVADLERQFEISLDAHVGNMYTVGELIAGSSRVLEESNDGASTSNAFGVTEIDHLVEHLKCGNALSFVSAASCSHVTHRAALFRAVRESVEARHGQMFGVYLRGGSAASGVVVSRDGLRASPARVFSSNHYLGLHRHPEVLSAASRALETYGIGTGTSAASGGYTELHHLLENELTEFVGKDAGILFPTGYTANLGAISALLQRNDRAIVDREVHASIIDGCRLAGATVSAFRHNDPEDLERLLKRPHSGTSLVIIESVYSMGGDNADLRELTRIAHEYGALILVDESHAFGFHGERGAGLAEQCGVLNEIDLYMTTLSKALASVGGFVAGDQSLIELIRWSSRTYIFQACAPPPSTAATRAALGLIRTGYGREKLWASTRFLRRQIGQLGLRTAGESPIVPVFSATVASVRDAARILLSHGVYTPPITHPAVPVGESRLRFTVTASHTVEDLEAAVLGLKAVAPVLEESSMPELALSTRLEENRQLIDRLAPILRQMLSTSPSAPRSITFRDRTGLHAELLRPESSVVPSSDSALVFDGPVESLRPLFETRLAVPFVNALKEGSLVVHGAIRDLAWFIHGATANRRWQAGSGEQKWQFGPEVTVN